MNQVKTTQCRPEPISKFRAFLMKLHANRNLVKTFSVCLLLAACQKAFQYDDGPNLKRLSPAEIYQVDIDKTADPLQAANAKLRARQFVHAAAYYKVALERHPGSGQAVLGLASSYSLLGHFKQADAYFAQYKQTFGEDAAYLNDYGFSMILRGDLTSAERLLIRADAKQPRSRTIQNNLTALRRIKSGWKE